MQQIVFCKHCDKIGTDIIVTQYRNEKALYIEPKEGFKPENTHQHGRASKILTYTKNVNYIINALGIKDLYIAGLGTASVGKGIDINKTYIEISPVVKEAFLKHFNSQNLQESSIILQDFNEWVKNNTGEAVVVDVYSHSESIDATRETIEACVKNFKYTIINFLISGDEEKLYIDTDKQCLTIIGSHNWVIVYGDDLSELKKREGEVVYKGMMGHNVKLKFLE